MRTKSTLAAAAAGSLMLAACSSGTGGEPKAVTDTKDMRLVNVVKLTGVAWFDRMEVGVKRFAQQTGIDATQTGADDASPEKQVKIVQDLIAETPTAITIVPNSPESLESVMQRARDAGIWIVTHEASDAQNVDADIEAFDNTEYGSGIATDMAKCMGGQGTYAAFVGHLTAKTHMEWVEGGKKALAKSDPDVTMVTSPIESKEDEQVAYEKTKEILAKYPDIKGFQGSASTDVAGIGRAVEEAGLADKTCVFGTSTPSVAGKYLKTGAVDRIYFWDPALAGEAMLTIAETLASGKELKEGMDLGIPGYTSLKQSSDNPKVWYGDGAISVDASNMSKYPF